MDILNARMNYGPDGKFANDPQLDIMVDAGHLADLNRRFATEPIWQKSGDRCWWAHVDGWVRFLYHNGSDENSHGFGGRAFDIYTFNGDKVTLRGPWSGRPSSFYADTEGVVGPVADANLYTGINSGYWQNGTFGTYPTMPHVVEACSHLPLEKGDFGWIPVIVPGDVPGSKIVTFALLKHARPYWLNMGVDMLAEVQDADA